jgi:ABC-2 type transport system permease protein
MLTFLYFELRALFAHTFVWILVGLLAVLMWFATYNGYKRVDAQKALIQEVKQIEKAFYEKNRLALDSIERGLRLAIPEPLWYTDPANPLPMSAFRGAGKYGILPPAPFALVSTGQSDLFPFYSKVAIGSVNVGKDNEHFENPFHTATGQFDLAFVCVFILPLLIIATSYNILSAEYEQGTWQVLRAMPIDMRRWLAQKVLFRYAFFTALCSLLLGICLSLYAVPVGKAEMTWLLCGLAVYMAFWFAVGFGVNLWSRSSANNALILLGVWLLFAVVLPSTAHLLATYLYPVPSRVVYVNALRQADQKAEKEESKILDAFYAKNPQLTRKTNDVAKTWRDVWYERFALMEYNQTLQQDIQESFAQKASAQRQFAQYFAYTSPAILLQNHFNNIAQTDTQTYLTFQEQLKNYEKRWTAYFKEKFMQNKKLTAKDYAHFPSF